MVTIPDQGRPEAMAPLTLFRCEMKFLFVEMKPVVPAMGNIETYLWQAKEKWEFTTADEYVDLR